MSGTEIASVIGEFDILPDRPIQTSVLGTVDTVYKPIDPVSQNVLKFLMPSDSDTYIDLNIKLYVQCKLVLGAGKDVDLTDTTAVTNNKNKVQSV